MYLCTFTIYPKIFKKKVNLLGVTESPEAPANSVHSISNTFKVDMNKIL